MPAHQENQITNTEIQNAPISTPNVTEKRSTKKIIFAIISVILLIGAVVAGVILVRRQQELRELASSASECTHSPDCVVFDNPGNQGFREVDRYIEYLEITNKPGEEARFDQGNSDNGCYKVEINNNQVRWERYGSGNTCRDISNIQVWFGTPPEPTSTPTPTPTVPPPATCNQQCSDNSDCQEGLTCSSGLCRNSACSEEESCNCPEPTPTPTDVPDEISAICNQVKVYDTSWNLLSSEQMSQLSPGDTVRFSVSGTASRGNLEKARFVINGTTSAETTNKKLGTDEFYLEYQIPSGQLDFNVNGQLHHSTLGWF